jgi:hypothetical protein
MLAYRFEPGRETEREWGISCFLPLEEMPHAIAFGWNLRAISTPIFEAGREKERERKGP